MTMFYRCDNCGAEMTKDDLSAVLAMGGQYLMNACPECAYEIARVVKAGGLKRKK
mgnify:CR=1 FL=1